FDGVGELGQAAFSVRPARAIETYASGQREEPARGIIVADLVGSFDGARDRLLREIGGVCTPAGHAVAHGPDPPLISFDRGEAAGPGVAGVHDPRALPVRSR